MHTFIVMSLLCLGKTPDYTVVADDGEPKMVYSSAKTCSEESMRTDSFPMAIKAVAEFKKNGGVVKVFKASTECDTADCGLKLEELELVGKRMRKKA